MTRVNLTRTIVDALEEWYSKPALIHAASTGQAELLALLLTHSAHLRDMPRPTPTPMSEYSMASLGSSMFSAASCAPPSFYGARGPALFAACHSKEWRCVEVLLTAGVPRGNINSQCDAAKRTALHLAVQAGQVSIVARLLEAGASHQAYNVFGRQPLHDACASGNIDIVKTFLHYAADPVARVRTGNQALHKSGDEGKTPYQLAKARRHESVCRCIEERLGYTPT